MTVARVSTPSIDYATSGSVLQQNSVDPSLATASLSSQLNFDKRFGWGTVNMGGSRSQDLSSGQIGMVFPRVTLTPSPVNITPSITWSPGFSYTNSQEFHAAGTYLPIVGTDRVDTLFAHTRQTAIGFQTPLRIGRWNVDNSITANDATSGQRQEFNIPDSTVPGGRRRVLYVSTFSTTVDWQTGINLPQLFSGTWKVQPGFQVVNATSAGPFMLRNQFSGGQWVQQGKRPQFSLGIRPAFFGFFPGLGPVARIRHSFSPIVDYRYAPGWQVPEAYARALYPTDTTLNLQTDPQQTVSIGLSQNFEAKLKPPRGDTSGTAPRKLRLLSINTDAIAYNFEQAKQPGRVGWQTQILGNTYASDLLPNFSLRVAHDLWDGPVGLETSQFSPLPAKCECVVRGHAGERCADWRAWSGWGTTRRLRRPRLLPRRSRRPVLRTNKRPGPPRRCLAVRAAWWEGPAENRGSPSTSRTRSAERGRRPRPRPCWP